MVVILLLLALVVIVPFIYAFTSGLKESNEIYRSGLNLWPASPDWGNYTEAWDRFNLPRLFRNSVFLVTGGMISQLAVSVLAAYSLSKLKPAGGQFILIGFLVTLMIPAIAYIVP